MEAPNRDPYLWQKAKARTRFQSQLIVYLLVNTLLWSIWFVTPHRHEWLPWPVWVSGFWGLGLVLRGIATYGDFSCEQRTQREYERLLRQQNGER
jgi:hypothetical protein